MEGLANYGSDDDMDVLQVSAQHKRSLQRPTSGRSQRRSPSPSSDTSSDHSKHSRSAEAEAPMRRDTRGYSPSADRRGRGALERHRHEEHHNRKHKSSSDKQLRVPERERERERAYAHERDYDRDRDRERDYDRDRDRVRDHVRERDRERKYLDKRNRDAREARNGQRNDFKQHERSFAKDYPEHRHEHRREPRRYEDERYKKHIGRPTERSDNGRQRDERAQRSRRRSPTPPPASSYAGSMRHRSRSASRSRSRSRSFTPNQPSSSQYALEQARHTAREMERKLEVDEESHSPQAEHTGRRADTLKALPLSENAPKQPNLIAVTNMGVAGSVLPTPQQISHVGEPSVIQLPSYYNPNVINPNKYAEQVQKRKLLWGSKKAADNASKWGSAQFSQDSDGKVASKFMRLMGIKGGAAEAPLPAEKPVASAPDVKSREAMFTNMEQQYEVARQVTHTMRGVGLGFSSQSRPF